VDHRAIFEGMNANLWSPNSGRILWMTQPAWPSTMWQILSSDYDTQGSFYGTQKACEPLHIQLNLATDQVDVVNTTLESRTDLTATAKVFALDNALLLRAQQQVSVQADDKAEPMQLDLAPFLAHATVIVELQLTDTHGTIVSRNLYWLAKRSAQYRDLTHLASTPIHLQASTVTTGPEYTTTIQLTNAGSVVSLANKLTLLNQDGNRILPAYYSDNYVSLLPGETQTIEIRYPVSQAGSKASVTIRGWNTVPDSVPLKLGAIK
jgi:archaellum component FlaF (FlaF/FlaG flagellin family)